MSERKLPVILFVIPALSDGGAQRQLVLLANHLQARGLAQTHLVLFGEGVYDELVELPPAHIHYLSTNSNYDPRIAIALRRVVSLTRPDLVFSWLHAADLWCFVATRILTRHVPWVLAERDSAYPRELKYALRFVVGRSADVILANSAKGLRLWSRVAPRTSTIGVRNILREQGEVQSDARRSGVISVSRLEPQKDPVRLMRAFCLAAVAAPGIHLRIAGQGSLKDEMSATWGRFGRPPGVSMLGYVPNVPSLLTGAKVFVTLSKHEGQPNALLEAVQAGLTIVASDIPEHVEVLGEDYPFLISELASDNEVARTITEALEVSEIDHMLFAKAVLEESTVERVVNTYMHVFSRLLAGGRRDV